ncbi:MAG: FkbM family methyltransferase [Ferruginibacter sp.]|nr:FkbM family methyltransferase [Ferruginibacter sp.]
MKVFLKKIYSLIPFKKAMFSALKRIWVPPFGIYQHLYFNDTITVKIDNYRTFKMVHYGHPIENELFWKGLFNSWEKYSLGVWAGLSEKANVIFDIGANTGIYSMVAKAKNKDADVHAFEPFQAICKKLVHNAGINGYDIHCNCAAISNYTGDGVIYTANENFAYSVTVNQNLWVKDSEPIKIDIKTTTLKDYIEKNNIQSIDLMKIDVETHEPEVMEGFDEYFLQFKPIILIEILNEEVAARLNNYFAAVDFDFYNIDELVGIKKVNKLSKSDYYNFLIVPKEKAHLYNEKSFIHLK